VFLALSPLSVAIAVCVFALLMFLWRYVSLGSIGAAAIMPIAVTLLEESRILTVVTLVIVLVVISRHHENIRRLIAGTESRFKA
jgi:glycerol-3-phosphate acyltransferase PlsY